MKAVCWEGTNDIRVERVPDPEIRHIETRSTEAKNIQTL